MLSFNTLLSLILKKERKSSMLEIISKHLYDLENSYNKETVQALRVLVELEISTQKGISPRVDEDEMTAFSKFLKDNDIVIAQ